MNYTWKTKVKGMSLEIENLKNQLKEEKNNLERILKESKKNSWESIITKEINDKLC